VRRRRIRQLLPMLRRQSRKSDSHAGALSAVILTGLLLAISTPLAAQSADEVVVPNFWNQTQRTVAIGETDIDVIRFVTTDDYPPFNFVDPSDRLIGFNVDLARAICEALGIPCTIQVRPFDDLLTTAVGDRADAAIAGIAITQATRQLVAFSDVYLRLPARFVVRRGLPLEVEDVAGREVAVVEGTAHEAYLEAFFPTAEIIPFADDRAAQNALRSGEADYLFGDGVSLSFWLGGSTAGNCCQFTGGPYLESAFFGQGMAIALDPGQPGLVAAVNAALRSVHASGEYAAIYLRYFPIGIY